MSMNPWLTEELAAARREDWLRSARNRRLIGCRQSVAGRLRPALGAIVVRAGQRIGGPGGNAPAPGRAWGPDRPRLSDRPAV